MKRFILMAAALMTNLSFATTVLTRVPLFVLLSENRALVLTVGGNKTLWFSNCVVATEALKTNESLRLALNGPDSGCTKLSAKSIDLSDPKSLDRFDQELSQTLVRKYQENAANTKIDFYYAGGLSVFSMAAAVYFLRYFDRLVGLLPGFISVVAGSAAYTSWANSQMWTAKSLKAPLHLSEQSMHEPRDGLDPRQIVDRDGFEFFRSALVHAIEGVDSVHP